MRVVVMGHVSGRMRLITGSEREVQPRANANSSQTAQKRQEGGRKTLERAERRNRNTKKKNRVFKEDANEHLRRIKTEWVNLTKPS